MRIINSSWFIKKLQDLDEILGKNSKDYIEELNDYAPIENSEIEQLDFSITGKKRDKHIELFKKNKENYKKLRNIRVKELLSQIKEIENLENKLSKALIRHLTYSGINVVKDIKDIFKKESSYEYVLLLLLDRINNEDRLTSRNALNHLNDLEITSKEWELYNLSKLNNKLVETLEDCFLRDDYYPRLKLLRIINRLSSTLAPDFLKLRENIINSCDKRIVQDYRRLKANHYQVEKMLDNLVPYWNWTEQKIDAFRKKIK